MDNLSFNLLARDWTAKEELALIQGIMKCGLGNWKDISEQYVRTKDAVQCEEHYFTIFYRSRDELKPEFEEIIVKSKKSAKHITLEYNEEQARLVEQRVQVYKQHKMEQLEKEIKDFSTTGSHNLNDQTQHKKGQKPKRGENNTNSFVSDTIMGYSPKRGDLDNEYDHDAEYILADMEFNPEDPESDIE